MNEVLLPASEADVADVVSHALAASKTLSVEGGGTKRGFGLPFRADSTLALHGLSGIVSYEPTELVMTARCGTSLHTVVTALEEHGQHLSFEPLHTGRIYGAAGRVETIGGVFMANLSGPRRFKAGAARDYLLGVKAVNGRGERYKAGGSVIKNVTGYDLPKLLAGSWGTLSIVTELTFKVLPAPRVATTVAVRGQAPEAALATLGELVRSPLEASGLAYLPEPVAGGSASASGSRTDGAVTAIRLEGSDVSVRERMACIETLLAGEEIRKLTGDQSANLWADIRDAAPVARRDGTLLKISIPPSRAGDLACHLQEEADCRWFIDAAGASFWCSLGTSDPLPRIIALRRLVADSGSLVLYRAADDVKRAAGVMTQSPAVLALMERVRSGFDPRRILNPGRLYPG